MTGFCIRTASIRERSQRIVLIGNREQEYRHIRNGMPVYRDPDPASISFDDEPGTLYWYCLDISGPSKHIVGTSAIPNYWLRYFDYKRRWWSFALFTCDTRQRSPKIKYQKETKASVWECWMNQRNRNRNAKLASPYSHRGKQASLGYEKRRKE